ncbi:MAG: glycosyltransferase family 2 protein [Anaerolineae bacterium]|nr:glycosyltransferase family 2 protein [Anaerolineae bacterium]
MSDQTVSVIIPNWNGAHHLEECLASLLAQSHPHVEIIVVDNASTDGSLELLAQYPQVAALPLPRNLGFTGACNAGLHAASGAIQVLLNNDTAAHPRWLEAIVAAFDQYPEAGIVASKMLLYDRRDTFHTAGDYVTLDGLAHNRGVWQQDTGQYDHSAYVFSACGGSSAYRRSMLDEVGVLDDDFFFSFEDVDLAWRAGLMGWRCLYVPGAVVYHKLKASGGGVTASFYDGRNRIYTLVKNYPPDLWRVYWPRVMTAQLTLFGQAVRLWRGAAARATLRGMAAGVAGIPRMMGKRKLIQARRVVSLDQLVRLMTPPFEIPLEEQAGSLTD